MLLRRPVKADQAKILEMISEFQRQDGRTDGLWDVVSGEGAYEDWLETIGRREMGFLSLPAIQLIALEGEDILGFLNLRLRLNEALLQKGGHIGYSVRPSQRGKGYAKAMLKEALVWAQSKNLKQVLLTCQEENRASAAVILANGGCLENTVQGTQRYWINLEGIYEPS